MERLPAELEGVAILRNLEKDKWAEAILAGPSHPKLPGLLSVLAAGLFAWFVFGRFDAPNWVESVLVVMFAGLVGLSTELRLVRRRLEAVIQLVSLRNHEQA